jgi:hypothetical protein
MTQQVILPYYIGIRDVHAVGNCHSGYSGFSVKHLARKKDIADVRLGLEVEKTAKPKDKKYLLHIIIIFNKITYHPLIKL